jgi:dolichyl-phosphate-mannose-protein mannosyltransferase
MGGSTTANQGELPFGLPEWPTMHVLFLVLGIITRYAFIEVPAAVVFDEHHFGRFTNQYTRGTYFFDIHPPLGKLVFYLTATLIGYDPEPCDYTHIHNKYPETCNFLPLRLVAGKQRSPVVRFCF